jgi:hypothetical protein
MNKVKMFFIAATLVLATAGVFAGKAKFASLGALYVSNDAVHYYNIAPSATFNGLQATGSSLSAQATITDQSQTSYGLYYISGSSYFPAYAVPSVW